MNTFWLGTHQPSWLATLGVPLMVSAVRLRGRRTFPRAQAPWVLDSGGYSVLSGAGGYPCGPAAYAAEVRRWSEEIGRMGWAAIQDWMTEPNVLARTGLSVRQHQERTVRSYLDLREIAPEIPWLPVIQGWTVSDYLRCRDQYQYLGVTLSDCEVVGVGSLCRRQATAEAEEILRALAAAGIRPHAFGLKTLGLRRCAGVIESADSMAWSFDARRAAPLPGCAHQNCANCPRYALRWRERLLQGCLPPRTDAGQ